MLGGSALILSENLDVYIVQYCAISGVIFVLPIVFSPAASVGLVADAAWRLGGALGQTGYN